MLQTQYTDDLFKTIKMLKNHATESNILRKLFKKYTYYATMFFNDSIRELEFCGKIVKMKQGGIVWYESLHFTPK
jgi:hypothetical protein